MVLSDFRSIRILGKGGFGCIYKGVLKGDGNTYALKMVDIKQMTTEEQSTSINEIRFLASFHHPYIIKYYDAFLENDKLYIVMELAEEGDLGKLIKKNSVIKRSFGEEKVWSYFLQLILALHCLHTKKVIHRDIKSRNIFLPTPKRIALGDLGCSRLLLQEYCSTVCGTPYYMSPELMKSLPYNDRSDIWASGVVLYELLALEPPFTGKDKKELSKKVLHFNYKKLPSVYSLELRNLVSKLLRKEQERRPSTAEILQFPEVIRHLKLIPDFGALSPSPIPPPDYVDNTPVIASIAMPSCLSDIRLPVAASITHSVSQKPCYPKRSKTPSVRYFSRRCPPPSPKRLMNVSTPRHACKVFVPVSAPAIVQEAALNGSYQDEKYDDFDFDGDGEHSSDPFLSPGLDRADARSVFQFLTGRGSSPDGTDHLSSSGSPFAFQRALFPRRNASCGEVLQAATDAAGAALKATPEKGTRRNSKMLELLPNKLLNEVKDNTPSPLKTCMPFVFGCGTFASAKSAFVGGPGSFLQGNPAFSSHYQMNENSTVRPIFCSPSTSSEVNYEGHAQFVFNQNPIKTAFRHPSKAELFVIPRRRSSLLSDGSPGIRRHSLSPGAPSHACPGAPSSACPGAPRQPFSTTAPSVAASANNNNVVATEKSPVKAFHRMKPSQDASQPPRPTASASHFEHPYMNSSALKTSQASHSPSRKAPPPVASEPDSSDPSPNAYIARRTARFNYAVSSERPPLPNAAGDVFSPSVGRPAQSQTTFDSPGADRSRSVSIEMSKPVVSNRTSQELRRLVEVPECGRRPVMMMAFPDDSGVRLRSERDAVRQEEDAFGSPQRRAKTPSALSSNRVRVAQQYDPKTGRPVKSTRTESAVKRRVVVAKQAAKARSVSVNVRKSPHVIGSRPKGLLQRS